MDRTERFYRIRRRLLERGALTRREIEEDLEVSHATFKRDLEYLRDRLNVPVIWSRERQAYVLDPAAEQFFWLAGQGGYGVQTSPGLSALAGALLLGRAVPTGLEQAALALDPARFRR